MKGPDRARSSLIGHRRPCGSGRLDLAGLGIVAIGGGLVLLRPATAVPPGAGGFKAVAVAVQAQDADVMGQAIEQCAGQPFRAEAFMMPPS